MNAALVRETWSVSDAPRECAPAIAPYSQVEFTFRKGDAWRVRHDGNTGWDLRPPTFVYAQVAGELRFKGRGGAVVIGFRVSPIVVSSLLSRPPAHFWNEPVAVPDLTGPDNGNSGSGARDLFGHALQNAPLEHLDTLSRRLGWSPHGLQRLFATSATLSPHAAEHIRPHLDACALLRERPDLEIAEIAHMSGFADLTSFTRSFRESIGLPPTRLRASAFDHWAAAIGVRFAARSAS
jgi:AraC-like DNA-binding protein